MMRRWSIHKYFIEQRRAISTMERRWSLHAVKMNGSNRSYIIELLAKKQMRQIGCNQVQTRKGGKNRAGTG